MNSFKKKKWSQRPPFLLFFKTSRFRYCTRPESFKGKNMQVRDRFKLQRKEKIVDFNKIYNLHEENFSKF